MGIRFRNLGEILSLCSLFVLFQLKKLPFWKDYFASAKSSEIPTFWLKELSLWGQYL